MVIFKSLKKKGKAENFLFRLHKFSAKEKNIDKVVDTQTNTMGADLLVCINRMYHFQKLLGHYVPKRLPEHISVPMLIFPS